MSADRDSDAGRHAPGGGPKGRPTVIALSGVKGGVGTTVLAANIAVYLASIGRKTVLAEFAPTVSDARAYLGLEFEQRLEGFVLSQVAFSPRAAAIATDAASDTTTFGPGGRLGAAATVTGVVAAIGTASKNSDVAWQAIRASADTDSDIAADTDSATATDTDTDSDTIMDTATASEDVASEIADLPGPSPTPFENLSLLCFSDMHWSPPGGLHAAILKQNPDADFVIVDLCRQDHDAAIDCWLAADIPLLLTVPTRSGAEHTYARVARLIRRLAVLAVADPHIELPANLTPSALTEWLRAQKAHTQANRFERRWRRLVVPFVLNQVRTRSEMELAEHMRIAVERRLEARLYPLASIDHDDAVNAAVKTRRPLVVEVPGAKASRNIERLSRRLLGLAAGTMVLRNRSSHVPRDSYHAYLDIDRGASEDEIRRAHKRMSHIFSDASFAPFGLFSPDELDTIRERLEEARDVLLDVDARRTYEQAVFKDLDQEQTQISSDDLVDELRPTPEIGPTTEFTGQLLRHVRESKGLKLEEISKKSRIGLHFLEAIEAEAFEKLPATVYVRGFVSELARQLELEPRQVGRTYVKRFMARRTMSPPPMHSPTQSTTQGQ